MQEKNGNGAARKTQFVRREELRVGDKAVFNERVWVITRKQSIPDRCYPWLYFAEEAR